MVRPLRTYVFVWAALLALLALTVAATFAPIGDYRTLANLGIALAKSALIAWFFMHLHETGGTVRVAALAVVVWLLIMFLLVSSDYATRAVTPF